MKKSLLKALLVGGAALMLTACGSSGNESGAKGGEKDTNADKGLEVVGETVKYDPNTLVNEGEPIQLEWWVWDGMEIFEDVAKEYKEIHPNVSIKIVNNPFEDYWTKLPLSLNEGKGPALFNVHNSYHENIIDKMEPYAIDVKDLEADFNGVAAHVIDDEVRYFDYGMMTGAMYYNKDIWEEEGLTDADIPKTWEQLTKIAEKLTVREGDKMVRSGVTFNPSYDSLLTGMHYQLGESLFEEDGNTPRINVPGFKKTVETLQGFYDVSKTADKDLGTDSGESLGQGLTAITYQWAYMNGIFKDNYPDLNFGVFEVPVFEEGTPYAYDRYNGESTVGLNANLKDNEKEVVQDFLKFYLTNTDMQKRMCLNYTVFPTNKGLAEDSDILDVPALAAVAENIDRYVFPGPIPAAFNGHLKTLSQDILYNGVKIDDALEKAQADLEKDLAKTNFVSVESQYKYADEAKK